MLKALSMSKLSHAINKSLPWSPRPHTKLSHLSRAGQGDGADSSGFSPKFDTGPSEEVKISFFFTLTMSLWEPIIDRWGRGRGTSCQSNTKIIYILNTAKWVQCKSLLRSIFYGLLRISIVSTIEFVLSMNDTQFSDVCDSQQSPHCGKDNHDQDTMHIFHFPNICKLWSLWLVLCCSGDGGGAV